VFSVLVLILVVGSVFEIFDDPGSRTSNIIESFATYFGGVLALFAAILTVGGVYVSTRITLRDAANERRNTHKRRQGAARHVLKGELMGVHAQLIMLQTLLGGEQVTNDDGNSNPLIRMFEIELSPQLQSFEFLQELPAECQTNVMAFLSNIRALNGLEGQILDPAEPYVDGFRKLLRSAELIQERLMKHLNDIVLD